VISTAGVPAKVDTNYLKSVGLKSGNDAALVKIFKSLGFLDGSGVPTDKWRSYKDSTKSKKVLGEAIKTTYSGVFSIYPDANRKDDEAIRNWIELQMPPTNDPVIYENFFAAMKKYLLDDGKDA